MLTSFQRKLKQGDIALAYLVFPLTVAAAVWYFVAIPPFEGEIKSVEIGNVEASIKTKEKPWEAPFTYTVLTKIKNPNEKFFLEKVDYLFEAKDKDEKVIIQKEGTVEIKGDEDKEIKEELILEKRGKNISFKITGTKWERVVEGIEESKEPEKSEENKENKEDKK